MRNIYIVIAVLFSSMLFSVPAFSQEQAGDEQQNRHRLGLSAIGILERLTDAGEAANPRFLITYRYSPGKVFVRAGVSPSYYSDEITHEGFTDKTDSLHLRIDARIGLGIPVFTNSNWQVDAGIDAVGQYSVEERISDSGFDKVSDQVKEKSIGGGPFVCFTFQINERISLGTDAALYFMYTEGTRNMLFENFPDFNDELDNSRSFELQAAMPSTIYLQFHF